MEEGKRLEKRKGGEIDAMYERTDVDVFAERAVVHPDEAHGVG